MKSTLTHAKLFPNKMVFHALDKSRENVDENILKNSSDFQKEPLKIITFIDWQQENDSCKELCFFNNFS